MTRKKRYILLLVSIITTLSLLTTPITFAGDGDMDWPDIIPSVIQDESITIDSDGDMDWPG